MVLGDGSYEFYNDKFNTNFKTFLKKIITDYQLFNGFAYEIIWSNDGLDIVAIKHVPFQNIRIGIETDDIPFPHYLYSVDFKSKKGDATPQIIRPYNPLVRSGNQLVYYAEHNPGSSTYPIPEYSSALTEIKLDHLIKSFHLNEAENGYTPQFLLYLGTGEPEEDQQDQFYKDFKREYSGVDGKKVIIAYGEGQDQKPEFIPINLNNSDERFITLAKQILDGVVIAHEIPPQLVVLYPGQLGSATERQELTTEFYNNYIIDRQNTIEEHLNLVFSKLNYPTIELSKII